MDMSHGSELPKVTSVYLETAEPIDWNSTMKVCAMKDDFASHRIYIDCTGCGGARRVAVGGKFWPKNADFAPREALNNVNNNSDGWL